MLDKNITKYIQIRDRQIVCGQNSSGMWYCKDLPVETTEELEKQIGEINRILNKYNRTNHTTTKKEKKLSKPKAKIF